MKPIEEVKKAIGKQGAALAKDGMIVGLGTGSTAKWAILELVNLSKNGLKIEVVATSKTSGRMANRGGLPLLDINQITSIDLTLDGADEVDPSGQMIKGAGGALFREKIIASMSRKMVVLIDENKQVHYLGEKKPLPLEILPFATKWIAEKIAQLGFSGSWRKEKDLLYITDNGNYIYDVQHQGELQSKEKDLLQIPGVIETGLFMNIATDLILGKMDGSIESQTF